MGRTHIVGFCNIQPTEFSVVTIELDCVRILSP